jgi:putative ABC transport system permease protein
MQNPSQHQPHPPRWLDRLLERLCSPQQVEQVMGDLHERFHRRVRREGTRKARFKYVLDVLSYMRPSVIKRERSHRTQSSPITMLKNYFTIAFRNLMGTKVYSGINILGLSVGLACSFLILLWVADETSYDRFHENGEQIHQVWRHMITGGQTYTQTSLPKGIAEEMKAEFPEVEETVVTFIDQQLVVTNGAENFREVGGYVGATFFQIFSFPFIHGDRETALQGMTSAVITERTARKLFGENWHSVIGKTITIDHQKEFTITGVVEDVPDNSSIKFDVLLPIDELFAREPRFSHWYFMAFNIFARLDQNTSLESFNAKVGDIFNRHAGEDDHQIFLQPFEDVYLNSVYKDGQLAGGRIEYIRIFTVVAVFLLLIACINFMNLATARSAQRAREIGVRKVIGAQKRSLVTQFMIEAMAMSLIAFVVASVFVAVLLPLFNDLTGKHFTIGSMDPTFFLGILCISLLVGIVSGSYPALYLSSFKPATVLRGKFSQRAGSVVSFRKGLVVFQFALSIILIVSTVGVYLQLNHIRTKNLGMDRENLLFFPREGALMDQYETVAQQLLLQTGIASVTASGQNPLEINNNTLSVGWQGKDPENHQLFYVINTYHDFATTMRMELVAGRDFSRDFTDSMSYMINEEAAKMIASDPENLQEVVGKTLNVYGNDGPIVGVIRNFTMNSLYSPIEPVVIRFHLEWAGYMYVRTKPGATKEAIAGLERVYNKMNSGYPLKYTFLDQQFEKTYRSEQVMGQLENIFAGVALFISCLGLFGLTSFTVEQRTRELGVRKVLGASVSGIVVLLSKDFLKLVVVGFAIAVPFTWYATNRWLEHFADRVEIGAGVYVIAGLSAIFIALITVSWQSIRAAVANPVDCLRSE